MNAEVSVLLLKQATPPFEGGKMRNNEYAFGEQSVVTEDVQSPLLGLIF